MAPLTRIYFPRSGGGAVPGFFFSPFRLAVNWTLLTRTSHVGGNSTRQEPEVDLNAGLKEKKVEDVQNKRSWYRGLIIISTCSHCSTSEHTFSVSPVVQGLE